MRRFTVLLSAIMSLVFLQSCDEKQKDYELKMESLEKRENDLLAREKAFSAKTLEYEMLKSKFDSIQHSKLDSLNVLPEKFIGNYQSRMVCESTNCSGYAVGDLRNENWTISNVGENTTLKSYDSRGNMIRLYSGKYHNGELKFMYSNDQSDKPSVSMEVVIHDLSDNRLRGTRKIIQENCEVVYNVELTKTK